MLVPVLSCLSVQILRFITKPMSDCLLMLRNERWKRVRSILTPSFSAAKMKEVRYMSVPSETGGKQNQLIFCLWSDHKWRHDTLHRRFCLISCCLSQMEGKTCGVEGHTVVTNCVIKFNLIILFFFFF